MSPVKRQSFARVFLLSVFVSLPVAGAVLTFLEVFQDGVDGVDGLLGARVVTVSPDGRNVYVAGHEEDAVAIFRALGGSLSFVGTIQDDGASVLLDGPSSLEVSPDGNLLFATADIDDTLVVFARDATTDDLVQVDVFQDEIGGVQGLDGAADVAASPDNEHVYVAGAADWAVAVFARDASTDLLSFESLEQNGVDGVTGLAGASAVTVSPDGELVLVTGADEDSLAVFARDDATGDLTFVESLVDGVDGTRNLRQPVDVAFSADGQDIYVAARLDNGVALFHRSGSDLMYIDSYPTPSGLSSLALSSDGRYLIASADIAGALEVFERDPDDGTLTSVETVQDGAGGVSGLAAVADVTFSPDDFGVYTAAMAADAMARFQTISALIFEDGFESGDTSGW